MAKIATSDDKDGNDGDYFERADVDNDDLTSEQTMRRLGKLQPGSCSSCAGIRPPLQLHHDRLHDFRAKYVFTRCNIWKKIKLS